MALQDSMLGRDLSGVLMNGLRIDGLGGPFPVYSLSSLSATAQTSTIA